jgi:predicted ATPase
VTQILKQGLGWRGDETPEERVALLERNLELAGVKLGEAVPLIAELLNLPIPEKYPLLTFTQNQKRKRLLANLTAWLLSATRGQPVVMAIEDLHWVDPSSLELTQMLVEQVATAPLMLLYTARPEFHRPWPMRAHHAQITLNRLKDRDTREMVAGVAARAGLTQDEIDTVVKRTDGVPLFAKELTRLLLEGDGRSVSRVIPDTLRDSLTARLDRLGPAKEVAQIAAVIGHEFSFELLQAATSMGERELQLGLEKLVDAELIYARGVAPEATYQFKHRLIQDAAYEALLKSRRKELHRRVAQTISESFPANAQEHPEVIARHWTEASEAEPAIDT